MVLHIFHLFVSDRSAFSFCRLKFALTRIIAESLVLDNLILFYLAFREKAEKQSMDKQVRVATDRRSEMGIISKSQSKMADVGSGIYCFRHSSDCRRLDKHFRRSTLDRAKHPGNLFASSFTIFVFELKTERFNKSGKVHDFFSVGGIVNAVDEGGATIFAISGMHMGRYLAIGK